MESEQIITFIKVFGVMILAGGVLTLMTRHKFYMPPTFPVAKITNLSVSNLNTSFPGFTASWEARVKITNPTLMTNAKFEEIKALVYYENDFLIASGLVHQPFSLKARKVKEMLVKISAKETDLGKMGKWVVEKMAKERESNGTVKFTWRIVFSEKRVLGLFKDHKYITLNCPSIRFVLGGTNVGEAIGTDLNHCRSNY